MPTTPQDSVPASAALAVAALVGLGAAAGAWFGSTGPSVPRVFGSAAVLVACVTPLVPLVLPASGTAASASLAGATTAALILVALGAPAAPLALACVPMTALLARPATRHADGWLIAGGLGLACVLGARWQGIGHAALDPDGPTLATAGTYMGLYVVLALAAGLHRPRERPTAPIATARPDPPPPEEAGDERGRAQEAERWSVSDPQLLEADKLESLGRLAGGIAHDFNNLLTSMLGNATMALGELPEGAVRSNVEEIETAARRARELVAQLLAYAGKGQLAAQAIDLRVLVEEMVALLNRVVSPRTLLVVEVPEEPVLVEGDPSQLRQLVMNLLTNASDALGDAEGTVRVRIAVDDLTSLDLSQGIIGEGLPSGEYVRIEVEDDGCGMDAETRRRIFEPYFTTRLTGRGLGLAALLGIVRNHHGAIAVDSVVGEGTRFVVWFPWAATLDAETDGPTDQVPGVSDDHQRSGTVLLAEDEEMVRRVSTRMLSRLGYDVVVAGDGEEALRIFEEHGDELAMVLLDVQMPGLDGREVLARITERRADVPVVMMTGFSEHVLTQLPRPPDALLRKPFSMRDLVRALDEAAAPSVATPAHARRA